MDWKIEHEPSLDFVWVVCEGDFSAEDCGEAKKDFTTRGFWRPGMNVLFDFRATKFNNLNPGELRRAADFHSCLNEEIGNGKMALLMNSVRDFGLARQYELIAEPNVFSQIKVFGDETEAVRWLKEDAEH